jgi:hypothetical protein
MCLKNGCNKTIPLIRRARPNDGGKKDGFGSLSAYRVCITRVSPSLTHRVPFLPFQTHLSDHEALLTHEHGSDMNRVLPKEASQYVKDMEYGA